MAVSPKDIVTKQPSSEETGWLPEAIQKLQTCASLTIQQEIGSNCCTRCWCQNPNVHHVTNSDSKEFLFTARENVQCIFRSCCGSGRWVTLSLYDAENTHLGTLDRPQTCSRGCCPCACCCLPELSVTSPPRNRIGFITERYTFFSPKYEICNMSGDVMMTMATKCCYMDLCEFFSDSVINVLQNDANQTEVACITKFSKGNKRDLFGLENDIIIKFLTDVDYKQKLLILGAAVMLDFNNFQNDKRCWC